MREFKLQAPLMVLPTKTRTNNATMQPNAMRPQFRPESGISCNGQCRACGSWSCTCGRALTCCEIPRPQSTWSLDCCLYQSWPSRRDFPSRSAVQGLCWARQDTPESTNIRQRPPLTSKTRCPHDQPLVFSTNQQAEAAPRSLGAFTACTRWARLAHIVHRIVTCVV